MNEERKKRAEELVAVIETLHSVEPITGFWRNTKRRNVYRVLQDGLLNTTNAQDGQQMVMYVAAEGSPDGVTVFVRERVEFLAKFHPVHWDGGFAGWVPR